MDNDKKRPLVRTDGAASYTGISKSTLEKLRLSGGGPAYLKPTRTVVYDPDDLDAWLAKHRRSSTSCAAKNDTPRSSRADKGGGNG